MWPSASDSSAAGAPTTGDWGQPIPSLTKPTRFLMDWLIRLLLAFQLTVLATRADALGDEVAGLKLNLRQFRPLSSNELRLVVDLAHSAGLKRVATIAAADGQGPESHGSLVVGSDEVVSGRRISQYTVEVRVEPFAPRGDRVGKFSLDSRETLPDPSRNVHDPWKAHAGVLRFRPGFGGR